MLNLLAFKYIQGNTNMNFSEDNNTILHMFRRFC